jgi:hypothetical protein
LQAGLSKVAGLLRRLKPENYDLRGIMMRDNLMPYSIKLNPMLQSMARQLEGEINTHGLSSHFYRLCVRTNIYERTSSPRIYDVPNPKIALIIMDILHSEFRLCEKQAGGCLIWLQKWDSQSREWQDWKDYRGHGLKDYDLDENWVFTPIKG